MARVNFYLKNPNAKKETLIYLQFTYQGKRMRVYTSEYILPTRWDSKRKRAKKDIELNQQLNLLSERVLKAYSGLTRSEQLVPSPAKLRQKIEEIVKLEKATDDLFYHFEVFCEERQLEGTTKGTIKTYQQLATNLKRFVADKRFNLEYDNIDETFYSKFTGYLFECGLTNNTVGKNIKTLKTFLYFANRKGWNKNMAFKQFKVLQEKVEAIYLAKEEIRALYEFDLSDKPNYERVRDLFIIGCWTGLRFGDFSKLRPDYITQNAKGVQVLKIRMEKTGKAVTIPLHHFVMAILQKYNNQLPKCPTNQDMNRKLKKIGEWMGLDTSFVGITYRGRVKQETTYKKYELLSTHTARRSFATNLYYEGYPSKMIMQITGHTTESNFLKYIKVDSEVAVEQLSGLFERLRREEDSGTNLRVV